MSSGKALFRVDLITVIQVIPDHGGASQLGSELFQADTFCRRMVNFCLSTMRLSLCRSLPLP